MCEKLYLPLLPYGKFAKAGRYNAASHRTLRFDVELSREVCRRYDTLKEEELDVFHLSVSDSASGGSDQNLNRIVRDYRDRVPTGKLADFDKLVDMWRRYHLNNMMPGTKAQTEALDEYYKSHPDCNLSYEMNCIILKNMDLLIDNSQPASPGYEYGSDWLCKPIEADYLAFIRRIIDEWRNE